MEVSVPESLQAEEGSWCLHKLLQPCRFFQLSPTLDWATPREGTHPPWAKLGCEKVSPDQERPGKQKGKQDQVARALQPAQARAGNLQPY